MSSPLHESLIALAPHHERFVAELLRDLDRRHPDVLGLDGRDMPVDQVMGAISAFVAGSYRDEEATDLDDDVVGLADSIMKTFALCLGRSGWKSSMALAWNSAMRAGGDVLLDDLRAC